MKTLRPFLYLLCFSIVSFSCTKDEESEPSTGIATSEIIEGLKSALRVGVDTATTKLSVADGYFKDQAVKLLLPHEVSSSLEAFQSKSINVFGLGSFTGKQIYTAGIPGLVNPLSSKEEDLILGINRAAESAAKEAGPIFFQAIVDMTITDANNILFGGVDTAASAYLNGKTRVELFGKFEPKIETALKSIKVGNSSVVDTYEDYVKDYNDILNKKVPTGLTSSATIASLMSINPVGATDLSSYSTNKGLDGLFVKIKEEEKKIRTNPLHRVTDILKKVFGALD
ncbi:MAG: hypothetical protein CL840_17845 [Crocinitomicaceae bacterium]|nr:hypothetical protein [Crocinitomicaceae bacterium]|tara:strand:- start:3094 stop:3945 length:852 start_codon:yes stop_codon:yes gene_type:complete